MSARLPRFWLQDGLGARLLAPLGALTAAVARRRLRRHRQGIGVWRAPVPVLVVGNLFVGGSGKTPLVIWLVERARALGHQPGVVLRGYGGRARDWPRGVTPASDPAEVGDEAVLIARRTGAPVAAGPDRPAAVRQLLALSPCDLVISDDGLQHYALGRDAEIIVLDAARGLGNGRCLPAGPLREPAARLDTVDLVVGNGGATAHSPHAFTLQPGTLEPVGQGGGTPPAPGARVHGIAGIGHPERFFAALEHLGYEVIGHPLPDHHVPRPDDVDFGDGLPVIMTEKDAVKCQALARAGLWALPVTAVPDGATTAELDRLLRRLMAPSGQEGHET
ncbi:tetraacyldisaccharide 4'-kinase [Sediminicurvatus halobius]|uniref:Tetraacyldisaccharide 4'-kinase n=1 Tax=Sediminicurvatus halobius TaxID=2182432 RepID=A0A2U2N2M0_9GAMM|nr:tetraacyldisaccharide 4'-kinase [Spiribacter halobius]PWG63229.1 tetraacyldisaccharide 4'-kinase [Spiribacter halobius]UEX76700.1 tetraacyldisaccharide 4'-kinase [Spiribacter halobius]